MTDVAAVPTIGPVTIPEGGLQPRDGGSNRGATIGHSLVDRPRNAPGLGDVLAATAAAEGAVAEEIARGVSHAFQAAFDDPPFDAVMSKMKAWVQTVHDRAKMVQSRSISFAEISPIAHTILKNEVQRILIGTQLLADGGHSASPSHDRRLPNFGDDAGDRGRSTTVNSLQDESAAAEQILDAVELKLKNSLAQIEDTRSRSITTLSRVHEYLRAKQHFISTLQKIDDIAFTFRSSASPTGGGPPAGSQPLRGGTSLAMNWAVGVGGKTGRPSRYFGNQGPPMTHVPSGVGNCSMSAAAMTGVTHRLLQGGRGGPIVHGDGGCSQNAVACIYDVAAASIAGCEKEVGCSGDVEGVSSVPWHGDLIQGILAEWKSELEALQRLTLKSMETEFKSALDNFAAGSLLRPIATGITTTASAASGGVLISSTTSGQPAGSAAIGERSPACVGTVRNDSMSMVDPLGEESAWGDDEFSQPMEDCDDFSQSMARRTGQGQPGVCATSTVGVQDVPLQRQFRRLPPSTGVLQCSSTATFHPPLSLRSAHMNDGHVPRVVDPISCYDTGNVPAAGFSRAMIADSDQGGEQRIGGNQNRAFFGEATGFSSSNAFNNPHVNANRGTMARWPLTVGGDDEGGGNVQTAVMQSQFAQPPVRRRRLTLDVDRAIAQQKMTNQIFFDVAGGDGYSRKISSHRHSEETSEQLTFRQLEPVPRGLALSSSGTSPISSSNEPTPVCPENFNCNPRGPQPISVAGTCPGVTQTSLFGISGYPWHFSQAVQSGMTGYGDPDGRYNTHHAGGKIHPGSRAGCSGRKGRLSLAASTIESMGAQKMIPPWWQ